MSKNAPKDTGADRKVGNKPAEEAEAAAAPPRKRGKLVILLLLSLLAGGGGAWHFLMGQSPADAKEAAAKPPPAKPPAFLPLEAFTVNLQNDETSPQYLQIGLSLKVSDSAVIETIKLHMPEIRSRVLLLLSSKKANDLSTPQGKQNLSLELKREISQPLTGGPAAQGIVSVLFTSFVIQ